MLWHGQQKMEEWCCVMSKAKEYERRKRRRLQFKEDYGIPDYANVAGGRTAQTYGIKIMSYNLSLFTCLCLGLFSCLFRKVD